MNKPRVRVINRDGVDIFITVDKRTEWQNKVLRENARRTLSPYKFGEWVFDHCLTNNPKRD